MPRAAREATPAGAEAFVRYYFRELNSAMTTTDTRRLVLLSDPDCEGCNRYLTDIRSNAQAHNVVVSEGLQVLDVAAPPLEDGYTDVLADLLTTSYLVKSRSGSPVNSDPGGARLSVELRVEPRANSWVVMGFREARSG